MTSNPVLSVAGPKRVINTIQASAEVILKKREEVARRQGWTDQQLSYTPTVRLEISRRFWWLTYRIRYGSGRWTTWQKVSRREALERLVEAL